MPTWVLFVASSDENSLPEISQRSECRSSLYRLTTITPVRGHPPAPLAPGWSLLRLESEAPIPLEEARLSEAESPLIVFGGVTQHLHYTRGAQQQELEASSHAEFASSSETTAVLIPIQKSPRWWQLAQDDRQTHFQPTPQYPGHTALGLRYVDRVFRKLYHSRYSDSARPYDFLTYFEFQKTHAEDFQTLLHELRDVTRNPEWRYVELEYEIWMSKIG